MSSLGEFLDAMVKLRAQKAQVAEYNASQQYKGMEALGGGIGDLLGGLGKGLTANQPTQQDVLANQLYNRANPPRAAAVNPALQGPADIAAAQMPGGPITAGGPFTGGVNGLQIQGVLDKTAMAEERLRNQGELTSAKITNYGTMDEYRRAQLALKQEREARLNEAADAKAKMDEFKRQKDEVDAAIKLENQATDKYKGTLKDVRAWNAGYKPLMSSAAGAKTQEDYDKAVSAITTHYQVGQNMGFKDVAYPEIPQPAFTRTTDAAAKLQKMQSWQTLGLGIPNPMGASAADIAAQKQAVAAESYMPQLQPWNLQAEPEEPSRDINTYMQQARDAMQGPNAQQQQGTPSAAAPSGGMQVISLEQARKTLPGVNSGDILTLKDGVTKVKVQ